MQLSIDNIPEYLLQKGVISVKHLIAENWTLVKSPGNHPVHFLFKEDGTGFVIKQPHEPDLPHAAVLAREAAFFDLAKDIDWARSLKRYLPIVVMHDKLNHVLVMEYLPYDNGLQCIRQETNRPDLLGKLLGTALAQAHVPLTLSERPNDFLSASLPWVLQMERVGKRLLEKDLMQEIMKILRQEPVFLETLHNLEQEWSYSHLIHVDSKLDNILVRANGQPRCWFIDWAQAGIGDPAWDLGNMIHSALMLWFYSIPFKRDQQLADAVDYAQYPLERVWTFAHFLVTSYARQKKIDLTRNPEFSLRIVRYLGAALMQHILWESTRSEHLTTRFLAVLQVVHNIFLDPESTRREFLF